MGSGKVIISLQYEDPDGKLGNRWKDCKTKLYLLPATSEKLRAGESGRWNSDRQIDIDSVAGNEHAVYSWNIVYKRIDILTAGWQDKSLTSIVLTLNNFNNIDRGNGSGVFNFRKTGVPITWKIED